MAERGRPRAFDRDEALRRAMRLFWTCGYEGASINDLAEAMGINKPSLYAAFGSKEALFREAIALYEREEGEPVQAALQGARTAREGIGESLRVNARAFTDPGKPRGCMVVLSALVSGPANGAVCTLLAENRMEVEENYRRRIERGIAEGDVPAAADTLRMAAFYAAVQNGLSVLARDGASVEHLLGVVDSAMSAWDILAAKTR